MSDLIERLKADAEHFALHGGDNKAFAKCLDEAADKIAELEATLDPRVQPALAHLVPAVPEGAVVEEVRVIYRNGGELQSVAMMANQTPDADTAKKVVSDE